MQHVGSTFVIAFLDNEHSLWLAPRPPQHGAPSELGANVKPVVVIIYLLNRCSCSCLQQDEPLLFDMLQQSKVQDIASTMCSAVV